MEMVTHDLDEHIIMLHARTVKWLIVLTQMKSIFMLLLLFFQHFFDQI